MLSLIEILEQSGYLSNVPWIFLCFLLKLLPNLITWQTGFDFLSDRQFAVHFVCTGDDIKALGTQFYFL